MVPPGMFFDQASGLMLPNGTQLASVGRRIGAYFLSILLLIVTLVIGYVIWGLVVWSKGKSPALPCLACASGSPPSQLATFGTMALRDIVGRFVDGILGDHHRVDLLRAVRNRQGAQGAARHDCQHRRHLRPEQGARLSAPIPGWYDDPYAPNAARWWDGANWTAYSQWVIPGPSPAKDLADEERIAVWARRGLAAYAGTVVAAYLLGAAFLGHFIHQIVLANDNGTPQPSPTRINAVSDVLELVALAGHILFLIWLYRAATLARRAGLPARRSPLWAWLGFLVPIVGLWFPYQVARDTIPSGDPGRRIVRLWWTCWLVQGVGIIVIIVISYFSRSVALLTAVVLSAAPTLAAFYGRAMVNAALDAHRRMLRSR